MTCFKTIKQCPGNKFYTFDIDFWKIPNRGENMKLGKPSG